MEKEENNHSIVYKVNALLENERNNWADIYLEYARDIKENENSYEQNAHCFRVFQPLSAYTSISRIRSKSKKCSYDIRFAGQSVGKVDVDSIDNIPLLTITEKQAQYAREHFGFKASVACKEQKWHSKIAHDFRAFYYNQKSTKSVGVRSEEHRIENFLLKEFNKSLRSENKKICNIQPIKLCGKFFQLPTLFRASDHNPQISMIGKNEINKPQGVTGGGIDILARVKYAVSKSRLAIIELKDENKNREPQKDALIQALIYATFIANLLRSSAGKLWWNIFREKPQESNEVPDELHLYVVTIMPTGQSKEGDLSEIYIPNLNAYLHPSTLYYDMDDEGNPCHFCGTFLDAFKTN